MPRPAQFDRDEALGQAMQAFWLKGYKATSMKDLTQATGLQPGSLYGAFESKRALFIEALEAYFKYNLNGLSDRLYGDAPPRERIRNVFERIIEASTSDPDNKGCMMVNTLLEVSTDDQELNDRLKEMFGEVETRLAEVVREAQAVGQIAKDKDPESLAQTLLLGMNGMRVFCKTRPGASALHRSMDNFLSILN